MRCVRSWIHASGTDVGDIMKILALLWILLAGSASAAEGQTAWTTPHPIPWIPTSDALVIPMPNVEARLGFVF